MSEAQSSRRMAFDTVPDLYDRIRPGYPERLVSDLIRYTGIGKEDQILEIGPGTGKLTLQLAGKGFRILALELGQKLSRICRRNLSGYPEVRVKNGDFDHYDLPAGEFNLILAGTSFHWLDPLTRMDRIERMLSSHGSLAIIDTLHINGGTREFFRDSQQCYRRWDPDTTEDYHLPEASDIRNHWGQEVESRFQTVHLGLYPLSRRYTTSGYIQLLRTYSDVASMEMERRKNFLDCISSLIHSRYNGRITKRYLFQLFVARKRS